LLILIDICFTMENEKDLTTDKKPETKLVDVVITDEFVALNVLVSFLNLAQRRGAFSIDESSKIWECIQKFQKKA
jgi:hypothetical protein